MNTIKLWLISITMLGSSLFAPSALAQFFTPSCSVDTLSPTLPFGTIDSNPTAQVDAASSISMTCRGFRGARILACVGLSNGEGNSLMPRQMRNRTVASPQLLAYQVYRGPSKAPALVWGSSNTSMEWSSSVTVPGGGGFFGNVTIPITFYGRIDAGQSGLSAGNYDSVMGGSQIRVAYSNGECGSLGSDFISGTFQLTASANISSSCAVNANNLNFGIHNRLEAALEASTTLGVTCSVGTFYTVRLDGGSSGNAAARRMGLNGTGAGVIAYELRHTSPTGSLWGDGSTPGTGVVTGTGTGSSQTLPVYGRVPVQSTPPVGYYEDTVTATVEY